MSRRARSSVVLLKNRRKQKGGSEEVLQSFEEKDMVWSRLSAIFFERYSNSEIRYEMKCDDILINNSIDKHCITNKNIKLELDIHNGILYFYLSASRQPILKWNLTQGILTIREDLLLSSKYYENNNRPDKIKKLLQWAIESIAQYYPNKEKIAPLKTCILLDGNKKEEKPMTEFLNDDLCYNCSKIDNEDVCDVSFGEVCKPRSAKESPMKETHRSAKTPLASPSGISPMVFAPTSSSNGNASVSFKSPMAPKAPATTRTAQKTKTATQATATRTARKQEESMEAPKIRWWSRLFRKKNTGDVYK